MSLPLAWNESCMRNSAQVKLMSRSMHIQKTPLQWSLHCFQNQTSKHNPLDLERRQMTNEEESSTLLTHCQTRKDTTYETRGYKPLYKVPAFPSIRVGNHPGTHSRNPGQTPDKSYLTSHKSYLQELVRPVLSSQSAIWVPTTRTSPDAPTACFLPFV